MTDGMAVPAANEVASMREAPPPRSKERRAFGGRGDDAPEGDDARTAAMRKDDETVFFPGSSGHAQGRNEPWPTCGSMPWPTIDLRRLRSHRASRREAGNGGGPRR